MMRKDNIYDSFAQLYLIISYVRAVKRIKWVSDGETYIEQLDTVFKKSSSPSTLDPHAAPRAKLILDLPLPPPAQI